MRSYNWVRRIVFSGTCHLLDDLQRKDVYLRAVAPRKLHNFYLDPELSTGLKAIKERDGITEAEQVRRAVREWLERKGVTLKPAPRRVSPRRKA
jgi:hypothetical protein